MRCRIKPSAGPGADSTKFRPLTDLQSANLLTQTNFTIILA